MRLALAQVSNGMMPNEGGMMPNEGNRLLLGNQRPKYPFQVKIQTHNAALDHGLAAEILHNCAKKRNILEGRRIHALLASSGQDADTHLANLLITMYSKCRKVTEAQSVFEKLSEKNLRTWNVMISAYAQNGHLCEAVDLFRTMTQQGMHPDNFTLSTVLSAHTRLMNLDEGRKIHKAILSCGYMSDLIVATGLISLYGKCGDLRDARDVFNSSVNQAGDDDETIGLWTSMINAYIDHGRKRDAVQLYAGMLLEGVKPNSQTYVTILHACSSLGGLKQVKAVHACVQSEGLETNPLVATALVSLYGRCNRLGLAKRVFEKLNVKDVVAWNAMLAAYTHNGEGGEAFKLFQRMQSDGVKPDKFSLTTMVAGLATLEQVEYVNMIISQSGLEDDLFLANTLVTMYGKHQCIGGAKNTFERMQLRNVISWTSLIGAYVLNGFFLRALQLYFTMNLEGYRPNELTFVSALDACLNLENLEQGQLIHAAILSSGVKLDCFLETALVNMYARCGSLETARDLFERMYETDLVTWTSIIGSHEQHGRGKQAMDLFQRMELQGLIPNAITFVTFITACSHAGLMDEALIHYCSMTSDYSILPEAQHCLCIINLLARSGKLDEAAKFIETMPFKPDSIAWSTLLAALYILCSLFLTKILKGE